MKANVTQLFSQLASADDESERVSVRLIQVTSIDDSFFLLTTENIIAGEGLKCRRVLDFYIWQTAQAIRYAIAEYDKLIAAHPHLSKCEANT